MKYAKRHYEDVAKLLREYADCPPEQYPLLVGIRADFITMFRDDNTRFDADKFLSACKNGAE